MTDPTAEQIIAVALGTHLTHPQVPASAVLDPAFQRCKGSALHFETDAGVAFVHWLHPPSPFADLLRQAFAPEITAQQVQLWTSGNDFVAQGFRALWEADVVAHVGATLPPAAPLTVLGSCRPVRCRPGIRTGSGVLPATRRPPPGVAQRPVRGGGWRRCVWSHAVRASGGGGHLEHGHRGHQLLRLQLQAFGGRRGLLHQGRILLGHLVHCGDGFANLADPGRLLPRG